MVQMRIDQKGGKSLEVCKMVQMWIDQEGDERLEVCIKWFR